VQVERISRWAGRSSSVDGRFSSLTSSFLTCPSLLVVVGIIDRADDVDERLLLLRSPPPTCYIAQLFATIQRVNNCLSNAMRGQNINLPVCVCACLCVTQNFIHRIEIGSYIKEIITRKLN